MKALFAVLAPLALSGTAAAPALADAASRSVDYFEAELSTKAGRAKVETRLRNAAHAVCDNDAGGISARLDEQRCVQEAMASARAQLGEAPAKSPARHEAAASAGIE